MSRRDSPLTGRVAFLVGARRSGTNWLQRVLGAHPDVATVPSETHLFSHGMAPLAERVQHGSPHSSRTGTVYMEREAFLDALRDLCDSLFTGLLDGLGQPDKLLLERTPWHARALDLIGSVYPDAPVLHIIRDGRDVARSLLAQDWGPSTAAEAAGEWVDTVRAARASGSRIDRYVEVRYEDLLRDPRASVTGLLPALGLRADPPVVERALVEAGVRFNVDPASGRVAAGKWRTELSASDLATVEGIAGPLLEECGYPLSVAEASSRGDTPTSARRRSGPRTAIGWARRLPRRIEGQVQRDVLRRLEASQQVVDRLLELMATDRIGQISEITSPTVFVRLLGEETWEGRGPAALARLVQSEIAERASLGRQVRGAIFPSLPTTTVVSVYRRPTGEMVSAVLAVDVESGVISGLTRFPAQRA